MKDKSQRTKGIVSLVAVTALYGSWGILSRIIGTEIPLIYQNSFRSVIAVAVYLTVLHVDGRKFLTMTRRDFLWAFVRALFGLTGIITFVYGIRVVTFGTFYFVFYAGMVLGGFVLGKILFSERLTLIKVISLVTAFTGLFLVYQTNTAELSFSNILIALLCGTSVAAWNTLSKKISVTYTPYELGYIDNVLGIILGSLVSLSIGETWGLPKPTAAWAANTVFGLSTVATGALVVYGFKRLEANSGSLVMLLEVLFGIFFGLVLFGETVAAPALLGGILIIASIAFPYLLPASGNGR